MFNNDADKGELKVGIVVTLHKKGDRNARDNYRGVVLLEMGSRILARIMANRIRMWVKRWSFLMMISQVLGKEDRQQIQHK